MTDTAQLERETEQTRAELEGTLDELRARITPGQIVDQLMDRARDGKAGEFVRNFGQQVAANPIPVAVVGIGLAWLMMANKNSGPRRSAADQLDVDEMYGDRRYRGYEGSYRSRQHLAGEYYSGEGNGYRIEADGSSRPVSGSESYGDEAEGDSGGRLGDMAQGATAMAHDAADRLGGSVRSAREGLSHMAEESRARIGDTASSVRHGVHRAREALSHSASEAGVMSRRFYEFCKEQPLIIAGLGLALGAAIGAMLPATRMEDELVGDTSDEVKRRASGMADRVASEASSTWRSARDAAAGGDGSSYGAGEHEESFAAGASGGADLEEEGLGRDTGREFETRRPQRDSGTPTQHRIVE